MKKASDPLLTVGTDSETNVSERSEVWGGRNDRFHALTAEGSFRQELEPVPNVDPMNRRADPTRPI